eukprot:7054-Heterococcus_DN1.PRE.4
MRRVCESTVVLQQCEHGRSPYSRYGLSISMRYYCMCKRHALRSEASIRLFVNHSVCLKSRRVHCDAYKCSCHSHLCSPAHVQLGALHHQTLLSTLGTSVVDAMNNTTTVTHNSQGPAMSTS